MKAIKNSISAVLVLICLAAVPAVTQANTVVNNQSSYAFSSPGVVMFRVPAVAQQNQLSVINDQGIVVAEFENLMAPMVHEFDLSHLPSGAYTLSFAFRDASNGSVNIERHDIVLN